MTRGSPGLSWETARTCPCGNKAKTTRPGLRGVDSVDPERRTRLTHPSEAADPLIQNLGLVLASSLYYILWRYLVFHHLNELILS